MALTQHTKVTREGVHYAIFDNGALVWAAYVKFGKDKRHKPGGAAFTDAARAQDENFNRLSKLKARAS